MAQFRGTLQGGRGGTSRLGSKKQGLVATVRGWSAGITVNVYHDSRTGEDVFEVREDGGSSPYREPVGALVTIRQGSKPNCSPKVVHYDGGRPARLHIEEPMIVGPEPASKVHVQ